MSEQLRNLYIFDVSGMGYRPIVREAVATPPWRPVDYDVEDYAIEDLACDPTAALVAVLRRNSAFYSHYEGHKLLEHTLNEGIPTAVIGEDTMGEKLNVMRPHLFIPQRAGEIIAPLSNWLNAIEIV